ncbi:hypothetical protein ACFX2H_027427 [Malus domestica]
MANRIKRVLPTVISDAQFAFVGSRRINILLVQELFHGYHLNNGSRRKRGLKQRDPPSTYLFVIAMELLLHKLLYSYPRLPSILVKNSKATNDCCQVSLVSIHTNLSLAELEKTLLKNYSGSLVMDESFVKRKSRV